MNYIKQLQEQKETLTDSMKAVDTGIIELFTYLSLPKFYEDGMVNINDVRLRLQEIRNEVQFSYN